MVDRVRCVLAATDLTPAAGAAVPFALSLADRGGTVHVLHVLPPREPSHERERHDALVADELRHLVPPGVAERGITVKAEVEHGDVVTTICDLAERIGADVVCLTARHQAIARVMGSVVYAVLRESRKPVLVLRPPPA